MISHYVVLGVDRAASTADIEAAFRRAGTSTHGQLGGGGAGGERTARIEEAPTVLKGPRRRATYDKTLDVALRRQAGSRK